MRKPGAQPHPPRRASRKSTGKRSPVAAVTNPAVPAPGSMREANTAALRVLLENSRDGINFSELDLSGEPRCAA